jgi:hypothetical protein
MTVSELKCMYCGEPIKYDGPQTDTERWWIHSSTDRYQCNYTNPDLATQAAPAEGDVAVQANDVERLTQRVQELEEALRKVLIFVSDEAECRKNSFGSSGEDSHYVDEAEEAVALIGASLAGTKESDAKP